MLMVCFVDTVDSITPDKVRGLRDLLNSSAMDIMYYNSPLYRDEVRVRHTSDSRVLCKTWRLNETLSSSPDHQGPNTGAEQTVHAFLLSEPWVWGERRQSVHRVTLAGLCHHLRHHDRMGPRPFLSAGTSSCRRAAGTALDVLWGAAPSRAATADEDEVQLFRQVSRPEWFEW